MAIPRQIDQITLAGTTYGLDLPGAVLYRDPAHRMYPQKQFQIEGMGGEFWKEWTMRSFHGGERLERVLSDDDLDSYRYHDAEGLDQSLLSKWGELKLAPALTRSLYTQSASMPMTVTSDGATLIVGLDESPFIKLWTSASGWANATAVAGSGAVTDLITAGTALYGVRNGHVITSADTGGTWTEVGSYSTAVGVAYVNEDLWVGKSDGVYNHTDSEEVTTLGCDCIAGYRENVYFGKDRRLYRYDGRATYLYDELPMGFNLTALIPYRQVLLILGYYKVRSGYRGAVYYIVQGTENHLYSLGDYSADHRIYACAGSDDEIFFANPKRGGADRYDLEAGGITNAPCWGEAGTIPFKSMAVCEGYLFIGRYENIESGTAQAAGSDTTHTTLSSAASATNDIYNGETIYFTGGAGAGQVATITDYVGATKLATHTAVETPADATTTYYIGSDGVYIADIQNPSAFATSGWLTTAEYDFGWSNDVKLFGSIYLEHRELAQGEAIDVDYSLDGGTTWLDAGGSAVAGTTNKTLTLDDVTGQTIKVKLTLTGTGTSTPTLTKLVVRGAACTDSKWMWDLRFLVIQRWGGVASLTALRDAIESQRQLDFEDRDGQEYKVVVESMSIDADPDPKQNSAHVSIRLREV